MHGARTPVMHGARAPVMQRMAPATWMAASSAEKNKPRRGRMTFAQNSNLTPRTNPLPPSLDPVERERARGEREGVSVEQ